MVLKNGFSWIRATATRCVLRIFNGTVYLYSIFERILGLISKIFGTRSGGTSEIRTGLSSGSMGAINCREDRSLNGHPIPRSSPQRLVSASNNRSDSCSGDVNRPKLVATSAARTNWLRSSRRQQVLGCSQYLVRESAVSGRSKHRAIRRRTESSCRQFDCCVRWMLRRAYPISFHVPHESDFSQPTPSF